MPDIAAVSDQVEPKTLTRQTQAAKIGCLQELSNVCGMYPVLPFHLSPLTFI